MLSETVVLMIITILSLPQGNDPHGYYDIPRFEGISGSLFNWFSNIIEPVTEGFVGITEAIPAFIAIIAIFAIGVYEFMVLFGDEEKNKKFMPIEVVLATYWGSYLVVTFLG